MNRVRDPEKVQAAAVCVEGGALNWLQWVEVRSPVREWAAFKTLLLDRFRPSQDGSAHEELMSLKQEGSVVEFTAQFEMLSAPLKDMSDELLKGAFITGLREDIRAEVRLLGSRDMAHVMP